MMRLKRIIKTKDFKYTHLFILQMICTIACKPQSRISAISILEAQLVIQCVEDHPFSCKSTSF